MSVRRVAISLEPDLLAQLDGRMQKGVYWNRSKAVADILRDCFSHEKRALGNEMCMCTISLIFDPHASGVSERINAIQHDSGATIISTLHVHVSHEKCLEVIVGKGRADAIQRICDALAIVRGVQACKLTFVDVATR